MNDNVPLYAKLLGGVDLVVIVTVAMFLASMSTRMDTMADDAKKMEDASIPEQLVELKTEQKNIKEDVGDIKDDMKDVIKALGRIEAQVSNGDG